MELPRKRHGRGGVTRLAGGDCKGRGMAADRVAEEEQLQWEQELQQERFVFCAMVK